MGSNALKQSAEFWRTEIANARNGMAALIRAILLNREPCCQGCPGWFISADDGEPERCDECATLNGYADVLWDGDLECLPEVQRARAEWDPYDGQEYTPDTEDPAYAPPAGEDFSEEAKDAAWHDCPVWSHGFYITPEVDNAMRDTPWFNDTPRLDHLAPIDHLP